MFKNQNIQTCMVLIHIEGCPMDYYNPPNEDQSTKDTPYFLLTSRLRVSYGEFIFKRKLIMLYWTALIFNFLTPHVSLDAETIQRLFH